MEASGIVGKVIPRNTKVGITYSFTLDPREDERWFGTFKDTPPMEGQYVEFEYTKNAAGFLNVDMKTLKVVEAPEAGTTGNDMTSVPAASASAKAYGKASNKDANIQWQSARNAAIATVAVMGENLALGGGKAEAKLAALIIQVNQLTLDYFDQSMAVSVSGDAPEDFRG